VRTHPEPNPPARSQPAASPPAKSRLAAARPARSRWLRRRSPVGAAVLAALAVEIADELVDGTKSAALPLLRDSLGLSYSQIGLLTAVPLIAGSLIELPMGILAGEGRRRHRIAVLGGLAFILTLVGAAAAQTFGSLLVALVLFFPASGAFVSLTQAGLMDAAPGQREQLMARWTLAGAAGAVAGPVLLAAVVAAGGTWRTAYLALAAAAGLAWLGLVTAGPRLAAAGVPVTAGLADGACGGSQAAAEGQERDGDDAAPWRSRARQAGRALRDGSVLRWVVLLEVSDLLLDVLTGFVALYLVAVAGVSPAQAALAVGVRLAADLAGTAVLIPVLDRVPGRAVLRASAAAALALYPAFLLVPGFWPKVVILALLSTVTAAWYPVLQAQLYASLPGQSGAAVSLLSASALVGALGPLAVGFLAGTLGLSWALGLLVLVPACVLAGARGGVRGDVRGAAR
jgi:MFS transporter, FSR family, fosmidomycin resistance protein